MLGSLDQYGKLRSSDSYIIHYTYRVDEAPRHVIYTWHGVDSSREKRGVAAVNAEQLANEYAKDGVLQVKLPEHPLVTDSSRRPLDMSPESVPALQYTHTSMHCSLVHSWFTVERQMYGCYLLASTHLCPAAGVS